MAFSIETKSTLLQGAWNLVLKNHGRNEVLVCEMMYFSLLRSSTILGYRVTRLSLLRIGAELIESRYRETEHFEPHFIGVGKFLSCSTHLNLTLNPPHGMDRNTVEFQTATISISTMRVRGVQSA